MTAVTWRPRGQNSRQRHHMPPLPDGSPCTTCGKLRYATPEGAASVIGRASERRQEARAYYAHGWWHLASHDDNRNAATAARGET